MRGIKGARHQRYKEFEQGANCTVAEYAVKHGWNITDVYRHLKDGFCRWPSKPARVEGHGTKLYWVWQQIKRRCYDENHPHYYNYGARGIRMCGRWYVNFENFAADVGNRPEDDMSIDRIDNDGNYEPTNVRWATRHEQNMNKRAYAKASGLPKGVTYHRGKYDVTMTIAPDVAAWLGTYDSAEEAALWYQLTYAEWFGQVPT